ncbi:hypothetical protein WMY93_004576 [Mugilogobius chulae]|uniref:Uncharacterized protein n=1 Tax=Mugilogobius chulae TaxID=88201 RepID=A0AAW0Q3W7_9GOBI
MPTSYIKVFLDNGAAGLTLTLRPGPRPRPRPRPRPGLVPRPRLICTHVLHQSVPGQRSCRSGPGPGLGLDLDLDLDRDRDLDPHLDLDYN